MPSGSASINLRGRKKEKNGERARPQGGNARQKSCTRRAREKRHDRLPKAPEPKGQPLQEGGGIPGGGSPVCLQSRAGGYFQRIVPWKEKRGSSRALERQDGQFARYGCLLPEGGNEVPGDLGKMRSGPELNQPIPSAGKKEKVIKKTIVQKYAKKKKGEAHLNQKNEVKRRLPRGGGWPQGHANFAGGRKGGEIATLKKKEGGRAGDPRNRAGELFLPKDPIKDGRQGNRSGKKRGTTSHRTARVGKKGKEYTRQLKERNACSPCHPGKKNESPTPIRERKMTCSARKPHDRLQTKNTCRKTAKAAEKESGEPDQKRSSDGGARSEKGPHPYQARLFEEPQARDPSPQKKGGRDKPSRKKLSERSRREGQSLKKKQLLKNFRASHGGP